MKTLTILVSMILLSGTAATAQSVGSSMVGSPNNEIARPASSKNELVRHDVTGFSNPYTGPDVTKESINRSPNLHPNLKPTTGGAVTDTVKYGPQMLSPFAPASLGEGERYLSAPDPRYDVDHESGPSAHRESGGLKLFSVEF
jgi:hypothetical protein